MTRVEAELEALTRLADELLPPEAGMPAPSSVLANGHLLARAERARDDQKDLLGRGVAAAVACAPFESVATTLFRDDAEAFSALANVIAGAYFMSGEVRATLGYPGQLQRPAGLEEAIDDIDSGELLEPVMERGPIFRPTPQ